MRIKSLKALFDPETTARHIIGQAAIEKLVNNSKETDPDKAGYTDISEIMDNFVPYTTAMEKGRYSICARITLANAEYNGQAEQIVIMYSEIRWKMDRERINKHRISGREKEIVAEHSCLFGYIATEPFSQEAAEDVGEEFKKVTGEQLNTQELTRLRNYIIMCAARIVTPYNLLKN